MRSTRFMYLLIFVLLGVPLTAHSFCGFYVGKADTKLFNKASKVVLVRDEDRTVLTMANDYRGELKEFSIVIPVPTFLEREQINVAENALIEHLDAYSAPRLVEYFDPDPCASMLRKRMPMALSAVPEGAGAIDAMKERAKRLGVTIEAEYNVGEYDIQILSAKESAGLVTWLQESGYKLPEGAASIVGSYLKQKMRFFVAKVNLEKQAELGFSYLRPLQVAYESHKFMLPIRLGTLNADGDQELFVFALTKKGRVEPVNYRAVKLPEGMDIPLYIKDDFANFYRALFDEQVRRERGRTLFLEYAWDMSWCDPCAADPLSNDDLRKLGVFWIEPDPEDRRYQGNQRGLSIAPKPVDVFVTRLHVRYNAETFPEDIVFQTTSDRQNFQARYVLRHPFKGEVQCSAAKNYHRQVQARQEKEVQTLASLTGWDTKDIREQVEFIETASGDTPSKERGGKWWKNIWQ